MQSFTIQAEQEFSEFGSVLCRFTKASDREQIQLNVHISDRHTDRSQKLIQQQDVLENPRRCVRRL